MGKPTIRNGITRAIKELLIPSVIILFAVVYSRNAWNEIVAGVVFVVLTAIALGLLYRSSKYWTKTYTVGFVFTAIILLFTAPDTVGRLVHPLFAYLGTGLVGIFSILMIRRLGKK